MKITHKQLLEAAKKAQFVVESDGAVHMPSGCDEEDPITGNLIELIVALGIEVENV